MKWIKQIFGIKEDDTQENVDAETRNLERLQRKWKNNPLYATIES